jgi:hypothetical protein
MATALSTLRTALTLIGVLDPLETPDSDTAAQALACLQDLIEAWATERLTIPTVPRTVFTLAANTATFTIGTGAVLDTPRPLTIEGAAYVSGTGPTAVDLPLAIYTDAEWQAIPQKATTASAPVGIYYDYGFSAAGYGTITLVPVPTTITTLVLDLPTAIVGPVALTTTMLYPPGYAKAFKYALALECAPLFGVEPPAVVLQEAVTSKAAIKRANTRPLALALDRALGRAPVFNIWTGV